VHRHEDRREAQEHIDELAQLVDTYGVPVADRELVGIDFPQAKFLIGSGKAELVKERAKAMGADVIIFDDDLTPAQQRNWEKLTGMAVIDRREVILGIFADRAQTREAKLQVELARAEYSLPRLKRAWTHLERQRGGGSMRGGAGEQQIEVDRRMVEERISVLKREIEHVRRVRATQRRTRQAVPVPNAALVGYTNAGKSSLMNALTGAGVLVENKLFATLDPTTRRFELPNRQPLLLTDTVGFIRKLPHDLVDAFKATLEETQLATFLVHVVDASHPAAERQIAAVDAVLEELEALDKPTILVLNKVDAVDDRSALRALAGERAHVVETSALNGEGLATLVETMMALTPTDLEEVSLRIPACRSDLVSLLHREGHVTAEKYEEDGMAVVTALAPRKHLPELEPYVTV
jgi:GTP-binding protein HflX